MITEDGFFLVDDTGDFLVESTSNLVPFVEAWRSRRGARSLLVRERDSDGEQHWAWARLLFFEYRRTVEDAVSVAKCRFVFEVADERWREMLPTTVTSAIASNTNVTVTVASDLVIDDCLIELEAIGANIDSFTVSLGSDQVLEYDSYAPPYVAVPVQAGHFIMLDCGGYRLGYDGTYGLSLYVFFDLGGAHARQNWIELQPGSNTINFVVAYSGVGSATARIIYYEQVA